MIMELCMFGIMISTFVLLLLALWNITSINRELTDIRCELFAIKQAIITKKHNINNA